MQWKGHKLGWCGHCRGVYIVCPKCKIGSCTGGGCNECQDLYTEFSKVKFNWFTERWLATSNWICWKFHLGGYGDKGSNEEQALLKKIFNSK